MNPKLFISYRRSDSKGTSGRLYDRISGKFGQENIFQDIQTIRPGDNYLFRIQQAIDSSDAMLVIIGPRFAEIAKRKAEEDQRDWVSEEIGYALEQNKKIIPVLVEEAKIPRRSDLPANIQNLVNYHAFEIRTYRFNLDFNEFVRHLQEILDEIQRKKVEQNKSSKKSKRKKLSAGYKVLILIVLLTPIPFLFKNQINTSILKAKKIIPKEIPVSQSFIPKEKKWVFIENQSWSAKNLDLEVDGAICYNNEPANCQKYGRLYTWRAAKKACAKLGGRLPTQKEWETAFLINNGGYYSWIYDKTYGNPKGLRKTFRFHTKNRNGLRLMLGGAMVPGGKNRRMQIPVEDQKLGMAGYYWSNDKKSGSRAVNVGVNPKVQRLTIGKRRQEEAFSCRCVMD